jgi:rhamnulokinase
MSTAEGSAPQDRRALIAIDLGAESCRVSLLRWLQDGPEIQLVHRFANHTVEINGELHWPLKHILDGLQLGLSSCADIAIEGIRSIGVDGWGVDYVRLSEDGVALAEPFCYRDERTVAAEAAVHARISAERMREITGIQLLRINTVYQLFADESNLQLAAWLNLPEYVLHRLGGRRVAEFTTATHTQMVGLDGKWSPEIFAALGWDVNEAAEIVSPGTDVGRLQGALAELPAYSDTRLIAPCCHDTASAIAAVPDAADDWAYISSGTWSLIGALLDEPVNTLAAREANFTNLGGADGKICFHKNVNGMWLLRQCLEHWSSQGAEFEVPALIVSAQSFGPKGYVLDVDDPDLLLPGHMPGRVNAQLKRRGLTEFSEEPEHAAELASFLFYSLAARYADVLKHLAEITGKRFRCLYIFGGGSQNEFLNKLTAEATGLPVRRAGTEGSTVGNFAVQLSALEKGSGGACEWSAKLVSREAKHRP